MVSFGFCFEPTPSGCPQNKTQAAVGEIPHDLYRVPPTPVSASLLDEALDSARLGSMYKGLHLSGPNKTYPGLPNGSTPLEVTRAWFLITFVLHRATPGNLLH